MQKFFDELISKILWTILGLLMILGGYNYLVSNLIKPPQLNSNQAQHNPTNQNVIPAIPQLQEPILQAPKKLEKGGILKIYQNIDRNIYPNPLQYTPDKIIKTDGLELMSLAKDSNLFQEASGYFSVNRNGNYNFILNIPETWDKENLKIHKLSIKIDGYILESPIGGGIYLEKGWHKIALFSQLEIAGEYPSLSWQESGQPIKPVQVWREMAENSY